MNIELLRIRLATKYIVDQKTGCWLWTSPPAQDGYGQISVGGKMYRAHRLSYLLYKGAIASRLYCCHTCDTPLCVNPEHLFLGTQRDNVNDEVLKKRHSHGCNHYRSKLNYADIYIIITLLQKGYCYKYIGQKVGLSKEMISDIANGKARKDISHLMIEANTRPCHLKDSPEERLYWKRSTDGWKQFKRRVENIRAVKSTQEKQCEKKCLECKELFLAKRVRTNYCSKVCIARAYRKKHPGRWKRK